MGGSVWLKKVNMTRKLRKITTKNGQPILGLDHEETIQKARLEYDIWHQGQPSQASETKNTVWKPCRKQSKSLNQ